MQSNKKSGIISFDCKIIWVNKGENGMKKTKIVSIVLIVMIVIAMLFTAKSVFAITDLTGTALGNNNLDDNNIAGTGGTGTSKPSNNVLNNTTNNLVLTTNNTSTYNNSSLPKTGVADSMPVAVVVVVLGISGVYAYKKMQEYKNI